MKRKSVFLAGLCMVLALVMAMSVTISQAGGSTSNFIVVKNNLIREMPQYDLRVKLNEKSVVYKEKSFWTNPSLANELLKIDGVEWVRFEYYTITVAMSQAFCEAEIDKNISEVLKKHYAVDNVIIYTMSDDNLDNKISMLVDNK